MDNNCFEIKEDKLKLAFDWLDTDNSGYLEHNEIKKILGNDDEHIVEYILSLVDLDNDGKISFDE